MAMYQSNNATYARMYTTTRMTRGMKMPTVTTPARLPLRLMRSDHERPCSTTSV